jgi:hypothetical protein
MRLRPNNFQHNLLLLARSSRFSGRTRTQMLHGGPVLYVREETPQRDTIEPVILGVIFCAGTT